MIDICYYNAQIKDELDGAADYIKRAINEKGVHPQWASYFVKMSSAELEHAATLVSIFSEAYRAEKEATDDSYAAEILDDVFETINDMYAEFAAKVRYMHAIYNET